MRIPGSILTALLLTACGAEVAGTASTAAAAKAEEARQAERIEQQARDQLDAAMRSEQERLRQAEQTAAQ